MRRKSDLVLGIGSALLQTSIFFWMSRILVSIHICIAGGEWIAIIWSIRWCQEHSFPWILHFVFCPPPVVVHEEKNFIIAAGIIFRTVVYTGGVVGPVSAVTPD